MCDCYHTKTGIDTFFGYIVEYGVCYGTKECDECHCGGDPSKCDFYPEKRKEANKNMNTAEMWLKAQEDGKMYECPSGDIAYSKEKGLVCKHDFKEWNLNAWEIYGSHGIDNFLNCEWMEMSSKVMTKAEAEMEFGIKIIG